MSRVCQLTGRGTASGNSRSHSNIASRRKFKINLQTKRIAAKFRVSASDPPKATQ
jgi:large subunit ribosomal protein L28